MRDHATRLVGRYPMLAAVPPAERAAIVRKALMSPLVFAPLILAVFVLPVYLQHAFAFLGIDGTAMNVLSLAKAFLAAIIPAAGMTFALSRWVVPRRIRKIMAARGYSVKGENK